MKSLINSNFALPSFRVIPQLAESVRISSNRLPRRLRLLAITTAGLLIKSVFIAVLVIGILLTLPISIQAKRILPVLKSASTAKSVTSNVTVKVKFRSDRKGVVLNFGNLTAASGVSYDLVYDTRGTTQNAGGGVKISSDTANAEVIFGTCSSGVCRYDSGISNAKLQVFITLKNGRKIVKPFRLKV